jgi:hypothetical protein
MRSPPHTAHATPDIPTAHAHPDTPTCDIGSLYSAGDTTLKPLKTITVSQSVGRTACTHGFLSLLVEKQHATICMMVYLAHIASLRLKEPTRQV